ncbi:hypothetical protein CY34DRAFT_19542 [Suillus luteus UH-Slu-Lm8-n1]|uniref:Uncharacterized protein n=1 Tax=Suillus luteus UH-Slu-Lm8-n1 TaxID=930992 RepID=A0A0C9Z2Y8_9AGAM|nr:hypothetical protein CY34DRAFT_19542 [Suillus luteus UH-Slu-Lm8-n1]
MSLQSVSPSSPFSTFYQTLIMPLGTTVIDVNGQCMQHYDGVAPTDIQVDHRSSGLVQSLLLPLLQKIHSYFTGSHTWPSTQLWVGVNDEYHAHNATF